MTIREAQFEVRQLGMVLRKTEDGEFRVNFARGDERTAYYTDDLDDAVNTAYVMADNANEDEPEENPEEYRPSTEQINGPPFYNGTIGQTIYDAVHGILEQASRALERRGEEGFDRDRIVEIANTLQDVAESMIDGYEQNEERQEGGVHVDIYSHNPRTPSMTRQHFEFIARTIRALTSIPGIGRREQVQISHKFADDLSETNENFDRERFLRASTDYNANPPILVASNPPVIIGADVHKVYYTHVRRGDRVHEFTERGTIMEGLPDGSIHIFHPDHPVWGRR